MDCKYLFIAFHKAFRLDWFKGITLLQKKKIIILYLLHSKWKMKIGRMDTGRNVSPVPRCHFSCIEHWWPLLLHTMFVTCSWNDACFYALAQKTKHVEISGVSSVPCHGFDPDPMGFVMVPVCERSMTEWNGYNLRIRHLNLPIHSLYHP